MKIIITMLLFGFLLLPQIILAGDSEALGLLEKAGGEGGYTTSGVTETTLSSIIGMIVSTALGFLGIIFLILIIYAGYNWMTARGNEEQVTKAKDTLKTAIIGLIIIVCASAIWFFIAFTFLY